MKFKTTLLTALLSSYASAQVTTDVVGYETFTLQQGVNVLSFRLHNPTEVSGTFETISSDSVTDNDVDFSSALEPGAYVIEFESSENGQIIVADVDANSGNSISLVDDVSSVVTAPAAYTIREVTTLADMFGANNSVGLSQSFNPDFADQIYVADGNGLTRYFFHSTGNLRAFEASSVNVDADTIELASDSSVIVVRQGAETLDLTVSGELKVTPTSISINPGINLIGTNYPVGSTVADILGDQNDNANALNLGRSFNPDFADQIYIPDDSGALVRYFFHSTNELRLFSDGSTVDPSTITAPGGMIIITNQQAFGTQEVPESIENL